MCSVRRMRSPLMRVRSLLSSSTVFIFSTQIASTGPSRTSQCRRLDSSLDASRNRHDKNPSFQSRVSGSKNPYIWSVVIALGFRTSCFTALAPLTALSAAASAFRIVVLAPYGGPTRHTPWRNVIVSCS
eukprot:1730698-Prymnesium_polylepis.1